MDPMNIIIHNSINELHRTIEKQIKATNHHSKIMSALTWVAVLLAIIQVIGMIIQVWLALRTPT